MTVSSGGKRRGPRTRQCSCHALGWEHLWEHGTQHLRFDEDGVRSGGEAVLSWWNGFTRQSLWVMVGWGFSHHVWVACGWRGTGSCFTFLAPAKTWQKPFGGPAGFPGRWFGCKLPLKPVQKEKTRCEPGLQLPFLLAGISCSQADSRIASRPFFPGSTAPQCQGLSWEMGSPRPRWDENVP